MSEASAVEYRPADSIAQPLIVEDKLANRIWQVVALPATFELAGPPFFAWRSSRARGLDCIGGSPQLMSCYMRNHSRLAGSIRRKTCCSTQIPRCTHCVTA